MERKFLAPASGGHLARAACDSAASPTDFAFQYLDRRRVLKDAVTDLWLSIWTFCVYGPANQIRNGELGGAELKADGTTITAEHSAKERLVAAATRIFFRDGFRATGIQAVLAAADVSKMTLYRHFKSKDDLVLETLTRYDQRFQAWLCERAKQNLDPRTVLLSIFDGLDDLVSGKAFPDIGAVGCPFVRAALENGDPDNPVHELVADHIRQIQDCIGELCKRMKVNNSDALAKSLFLEFQGAYLTVMMTGERSIISDAKEMAAFLIEVDSSS